MRRYSIERRKATLRALRHRPAALVALGSLLLAVVVVAPATRGGWVLLLDWTAGPHPSVPRMAWGLDTGLLYGPSPLFALLVGYVVGHATASWLLVAALFPPAAVAMSRLVGGPLVRRGSAALLYCVNPFVFERLAAGQVIFLLAYALFPFAVRSILHAAEAEGARRLVPAAWVAGLVAVGPHWAWPAGLVVACVVIARRQLDVLLWAASIAVVSAALSAHLLLPQLGQPAAVDVDADHLQAFATRGDAHLGLFPNVAALYGFFRPNPALPKQFGGWPFLFAGLGVVMILGILRLRTDRDAWRRHGVIFGSAGAMAYLLALGAQGPTGDLYRWAISNVPGFAVMREPQKFVAVLALLYAVLFGFGVEELARRAGGGRRALASVLLAGALVVAYTPDLAWGLSGRLTPRRYPDGWWQADRHMGPGGGKVLFLPWHKFLAFPFTEEKVVANPAADFFRRDVIAGDDPELPDVGRIFRSPRSVFLEDLFAEGSRSCAAGELLAPLGVEFVVLAKTVDWRRFAWLDDQKDLHPVLEDDDIVVYRNRSYVAQGYRVPSARVLGDVGEATRATCSRSTSAEALLASDGPGPGTAPPMPDHDAGSPDRVVGRRSPVRYDVRGAPSGWIVLPEPYDPRWQWDGRRPVRLLQGVTAFPADGSSRGSVRFDGWERVRLGYMVSAVAGTALFVLVRRTPRSAKTGTP